MVTLAGARRRWFRFPLAAATAASVGGCHSCRWSSFAAATAATAEQLPQLSSCHSCHSCQGDAKHGALVHVCMHLSMIGSMVKCMCACICLVHACMRLSMVGCICPWLVAVVSVMHASSYPCIHGRIHCPRSPGTLAGPRLLGSGPHALQGIPCEVDGPSRFPTFNLEFRRSRGQL